MRKVAYICEPFLGGLYTFFQEMRPAFRSVGVDFRCVAPHPKQDYGAGRNIGDEGVVLIPFDGDDEEGFVGRLSQYLVQEDYKGVVVVPGNSVASTLLPCILPPSIVSIAMVPHNGRGVYRPTSRIRRHLDWIVAVNTRLHDDLIERYGVGPAQVKRIFIGINTASCGFQPRKAGSGRLTVAFTSRLEDLQKNVLILPEILDAVRKLGGEYVLRILCGGPDEAALRKKFRRMNLLDQVDFEPKISREDLLVALASADVFLMTSRFEGCPHALIEAMACGCVPVVSQLPGIFDTMVQEGVEGFLCDLDNPRDFARCLHELAQDAGKRERMGTAARERAVRDFDVKRAVAAYGELLVQSNSGKSAEPLSLCDAFRLHGRIGKGNWRAFIPSAVKKWVRTHMAKKGRSM